MDPKQLRAKLYGFLSEKKLVSTNIDEWTKGYSNEQQLHKLYSKLKQNNYVLPSDLEYSTFKSDFFGDIYKSPKKKEYSSISSKDSETSSDSPLSELDATSQQNTTSEADITTKYQSPLDDSDNKVDTKQQKKDPITSNIQWMDGDASDKDNVLITDIPIAERKKTAKFSPGNIYPKELLDLEYKLNQDLGKSAEILEDLKKRGEFGDDDKLYSKIVQERFEGTEKLLKQIEDDKQLYLEEGIEKSALDEAFGGNSISFGSPLQSSIQEKRSVKTYSELYNSHKQKYSNYLEFGNFEGEKRKINRIDEKKEMYQGISETVKKAQKTLDSMTDDEVLSMLNREAGRYGGYQGETKYRTLRENATDKLVKRELIKALDDAGLEGKERAEFREFVLASIQSEERVKKVEARTKELAKNAGINILGEESAKEYEEAVNKIDLDYQSKSNQVIQSFKDSAIQLDESYKEGRSNFIKLKTEEAESINQAFEKEYQSKVEEATKANTALVAAVKSGQITEDQYNQEIEKLNQPLIELREQRDKALEVFNEKTSQELSVQYQLHLRERSALLNNPTDALKKLEMLRSSAEAEAMKLQDKYDLSDEDKEKLEEFYAIANAEATAENKMKKDIEWGKLNYAEKFLVSLESGLDQVVESIGLTAQYFSPGLDNASFTNSGISDRALKRAQKDFGKFEWLDMADFDFIVSSLGEQLPIMATLALPGGAVTKGTGMIVGRTTMSAAAKNAIAATTGAIATRPFEAAMGAGAVTKQLLTEGKSFEEAYDAGNRVFKNSMLLVATDALQNYLWFTKGGRIINTGNTAQRSAGWLLEKGAGSLSEVGEELFQEGVQKRETDSSYKELGLMDAALKFAGTEEGRKTIGATLLMGPAIDSYGFVTSGRSDVARLNKQFRDQIKMSEEMADMGGPKGLAEKMALRDLQLRETFATLRARGEMSASEYKEVVSKLDYHVGMMKKSMNGEIPFAWDSDRFTAFSQFSYESQKLREEAEKLPKTDKAGKDRLKSRADALDKQLKSLMTNPKTHTYAIDGTQLTEDEFRLILESSDREKLAFANIKTSNADIVLEYYDKGLLPNKEQIKIADRAKDMVSDAMGTIEEGKTITKKYKSESEAINGLIEEKRAKVSDLEKSMEGTNGYSGQWNLLDRELNKTNQEIADLEIYAAKNQLTEDVKAFKKEQGESLASERSTTTTEQDQKGELTSKLEGELDALKEELDLAKYQRLKDKGEENVELDADIARIEADIKNKEKELTQAAALPDQQVKDKPTFDTQEAASDYYDSQIQELSIKERDLIDKQGTKQVDKDLADLRENKRNLQKEKETALQNFDEDGAVMEGTQATEEDAVKGMEDTDEADTPMDSPKDDRTRGYRVQYGKKIPRREKVKNKITGKKTKTLFSRTQNNNPIELDTEYTIMEADDVIPSHKETGGVNLEYFLNEAQPRPREQGAARDAARQKGENINPNELMSNYSAYSGAMVVNERGELIQGTGRSQGVKYYYKNNNDGSYQAALKEEASALGINPEKIDTFKNPVLVRMAKSSDSEAIKFGQYKSKDLEDAETPGEGEKARGRVIEEQQFGNIKGLLKNISDSIKGVKSLTKVIRSGGKDLIDSMVRNNLLKANEMPALFSEQDPSKPLTDYGMFKLKSLIKGVFFRESSPRMATMYESLPYAMKDGLERSMADVLGSNPDMDIIDNIYEIIAITNNQQASGSDFGSWESQIDIDGKTPKDYFSKESLEMAKFLLTANNGKMMKASDIANTITNFVNDTAVSDGGMFATQPMSKQAAIDKNFKKNEESKVQPKGGDRNTGGDKGNKKGSKGKKSRSNQKDGQRKIRKRNAEHNSKKGNKIVPTILTDTEKQARINKKGVLKKVSFMNRLKNFAKLSFGNSFDLFYGKNKVTPRVIFNKQRTSNEIEGFFNRKTGEISVEGYDVDTLAHELSHWIDSGYNIEGKISDEAYATIKDFEELGSPPVIEELTEQVKEKLEKEGVENITDEAFEARLQQAIEIYKRREGIAEFLNAMMVNNDAVAALYPKAHAEVVDIMAEGNDNPSASKKKKRAKKVVESFRDLSMDFSHRESLTMAERAEYGTELDQTEKESMKKDMTWNEWMREKMKDFSSKFGLRYDGNNVSFGFLKEFEIFISDKLAGVDMLYNSLLLNKEGGPIEAKDVVAKNFLRQRRLLMGTKSKLARIFSYGVPTIKTEKDGSIGYEYSKDKDGNITNKGLGWVFEPLKNASSLIAFKQGKKDSVNKIRESESKAKTLQQFMTAERTIEYASKFAAEAINSPNKVKSFLRMLKQNGRNDLAQEIASESNFYDKLEEVSKVEAEINTIKKQRSDISKDVSSPLPFSKYTEADLDAINEKLAEKRQQLRELERDVTSEVQGVVFDTLGVLQNSDRGLYTEIIQKFARDENLTGISDDNLQQSDLDFAFNFLDEWNNTVPEKSKQAYNEARDRYRELANKSLEYQNKLGYLSDAKLADIKRFNSQYVALHRLVESELGEITDDAYNMNSYSSTVGKDAIINGVKKKSIDKAVSMQKKAKGGNEIRMNAFDSLHHVIEKSIELADKNYVAASFFDAFDNVGDGFTAGFMKKISEEEYNKSSEKNKNVYKVYRKGEPEYYQFNDPNLYDQFMRLGDYMDPAAANVVVKTFNVTMKKWQRIITSFPLFPIKDAIRQEQSYRAGISKNKALIPFTDMYKRGKEYWLTKEEAAWKFDMYGAGQGGSMSYYSSPDRYDSAMKYAIEELMREDGVKVMTGRRFKANYDNWLMSLDKKQRLEEFRLEYQKQRKAGHSDVVASQMAAIASRDLMDFAVSGTFAGTAGAFYPFFNPAIRGVGKTFNIAKDLTFLLSEGDNMKAKAGNAAKAWGKIAFWSVLPTILERYLAERGDYEEDLRELPWWRKDLFHNIKIGGMWITIPKSQELSVFSALTNRLIEENVYNQDVSSGDYAKILLHGAIPFALPTGGPLFAIGETMANYSKFRDSKIDKDENVRENELKYSNKNASNFAVLMEEITDSGLESIKPMFKPGKSPTGLNATHYDYLMSSWLGDWGDLLRMFGDAIPMDREVSSKQGPAGWAIQAISFIRKESPFDDRNVIEVLDYVKDNNAGTLSFNKDYKAMKGFMSSLFKMEKDDPGRDKAIKEMRTLAKSLKKRFRKIEEEKAKFLSGEPIVIEGKTYVKKKGDYKTNRDVVIKKIVKHYSK